MKAIKIAAPNGDYRVKDGGLQFRPHGKRRYNDYSTDARFGLELMIESWLLERDRVADKLRVADHMVTEFRLAMCRINAEAK